MVSNIVYSVKYRSSPQVGGPILGEPSTNASTVVATKIVVELHDGFLWALGSIVYRWVSLQLMRWVAQEGDTPFAGTPIVFSQFGINSVSRKKFLA